MIVWGIAVLSTAAGVACCVLAWRMAWRTLGTLQRPAHALGAKMSDPMILVIVAGMLCLIVGAAASFGLFQGGSRVAYALRRRSEA